jgi:hypothetical protein
MNIGANVMGLVAHIAVNVTGKLIRMNIAKGTASSICTGIGMNDKNKPTPTPPATERRPKCHKLGSSMRRLIQPVRGDRIFALRDEKKFRSKVFGPTDIEMQIQN